MPNLFKIPPRRGVMTKKVIYGVVGRLHKEGANFGIVPKEDVYFVGVPRDNAVFDNARKLN